MFERITLESFRFDNDYKYAIWLEVFLRILEK